MIDAHCHLHFPGLPLPLPDLLARAADAGVTRFHVNAVGPADAPDALRLRDRHPGCIDLSLGVHPWLAASLPPDWDALLHRALLAHAPAGVGEIGLDDRPPPPSSPFAALPLPSPDRQFDVFRVQWDLSVALARPVTLHCRGKAWDVLLPFLLRSPPHPAGVLLHAYSGPPTAIPALAARNCRFSLGTALARPHPRRALALRRAIPPSLFLLESDAPSTLLPHQLPALLAR